MKKVLFGTTLLWCAASSCAVMFNGSRQSVTIRSMTPEAKIYIDGEEAGTDAVTHKMERNSNHTVTVKKDGCETKTVELKKHLEAGWIVFDALFNWGAFLTDAPTGAWNSFDKDQVVVELTCPKPATAPVVPITKP